MSSTVVRIETAKSFLQKRMDSHEMQDQPINDELFTIELPLGPGNARVSVLALMTSRKKNSIQIVLDDSKNDRITRTFISDEIPPDYAPRSVGSLARFLASNHDCTQEIILAGGVMHGNLTIARAVQIKLKTGVSADEAMSESINISNACSNWNQRLMEMAHQALMQA